MKRVSLRFAAGIRSTIAASVRPWPTPMVRTSPASSTRVSWRAAATASAGIASVASSRSAWVVGTTTQRFRPKASTSLSSSAMHSAGTPSTKNLISPLCMAEAISRCTLTRDTPSRSAICSCVWPPT
ncbi:hypothetical protein FQZ97_1015220 [compost metagenome]